MGRRYIVEEVGSDSDGCAFLGCCGIIIVLGTIFQAIKVFLELTVMIILKLWSMATTFFQNSIHLHLPALGLGVLTLIFLALVGIAIHKHIKVRQRNYNRRKVKSISLEELARMNLRYSEDRDVRPDSLEKIEHLNQLKHLKRLERKVERIVREVNGNSNV